MSLWDKLLGRAGSQQHHSVSTPPNTSERQGKTALRTASEDGTPISPVAAPSLEPDSTNKIAGTFPVKKVLGSGSMGTVYLVQHPSWNVEVALKVPKAELIADADNRHRITVEAEAWTELGLHPHIAYCYYVQTLNDVLLMVVEYLDGGNLADWIGQHGQSADLKTKLDLAIQFCHGLEHAHSRGLIHRDIKPSNVLLTKDGQLKLTDFGIARVSSHQAGGRAPFPGAPVDGTMVGIGTEDYMPPEQWLSAQVDARADLFAFGVCLYELFCGKRPYAGRLIGSPQEAIDPALLNPVLPPALCELLWQCVGWDKVQRPETAALIRRRLCTIYQEQHDKASDYAELSPHAATAATLNNRALSYIELGKPELAKRAWQSALLVDPNQIEVVYNLALHEWRSGDLGDDGVIVRLKAVTHAAGNPWVSSFLQALVFRESGDLVKAQALLKEMTETRMGCTEDPEWADIPLAIGAGDVAAESELHLTGHSTKVETLGLSVDGRYAVSGSQDGSIKHWDLAKGECLRTLPGHTKHVTNVALAADGRILVSGGVDCLIRVWDLVSGRCIRTITEEGSIKALGINANGRLVIGAHAGHSTKALVAELRQWIQAHLPPNSWPALDSLGSIHPLKLWEVASGRCLAELTGHTDSIECAALSADGRMALSGSRDKTIMVWDLTHGICARTLHGHTAAVTAVALSADGKLAVSGSEDWSLKLWDLSTGQCMRTFVGHTYGVHFVSISGDCRHVFSESRGSLKYWELTSGRCIRTLTYVTSVCVSSDGRYALVGLLDNSVNRWPLATARLNAPWRLSQLSHPDLLRDSGSKYLQATRAAEAKFLKGEACEALALLKGARTGSFRRHADAFDLWVRLGRQMRKTRLRDVWSQDLSTAPASTCCLSADGHRAVSGGDNCSVTIWNVATGKSVRTIDGHGDQIWGVWVTTDSSRVLIGGGKKRFGLWAISGGKCLRSISVSDQGKVPDTFSLSPDERFVLSGGNDGKVRLWSLATGHCLRTYLTPLHNLLSSGSVGYGADGRHAFASADGLATLFDLATSEIIQTFNGLGDVKAFCASPDGRQVLTVNRDVLGLWDIASGSCLRTISNPDYHRWYRRDSASSDGRTAISVSPDNTLQLWDLATGNSVAKLAGHLSEVKAVHMSREGCHAISCADDGVKLWTFDWELEEVGFADWDEGARPYLEVFLRAQQPYGAQLPRDRQPTDEEVTLALTRSGRPVWTENDFQRLLHTLGCVGYGWLMPEGVRQQLERMAGEPVPAMTIRLQEKPMGVLAKANAHDSPKAESVPRQGRKVGRNESCPCGSGKLYKRCHGSLS